MEVIWELWLRREIEERKSYVGRDLGSLVITRRGSTPVKSIYWVPEDYKSERDRKTYLWNAYPQAGETTGPCFR
jgi:hypothetical protein